VPATPASRSPPTAPALRRPSQIVSHELPLDDAPSAYDQFDRRADGWTKVILHPGTAS